MWIRNSEAVGLSASNLTVFYEVAVRMLARDTVIQMLDWVWKICFHHIPFTWLTSWCFSFSPRLGCLSVLMTWQLTFPQKERYKRIHGWSCNIFYALVLEVTYHHFHISYWSYRWPVFSVGGNYTRALVPGGKDHWKLFWNLATIPHE